METIPFHPSVGEATLVVLEQGGIFCVNLDSRNRWTIGRATSESAPDISLSSPIASRIHGEFLLIDSQWFYCDLGSLNGTLHNNVKIRAGLNRRVKPVLLENGEVLRIDRSGDGKADPRGVWMLFSTEGINGEWKYYSLSDKSSVVIGRDKTKCDLAQPLPYISAQHCRITLRDGNYYVSDCGSMAGTWLNGYEVHKAVQLKSKDQISICDCHFFFTGAGLMYNDRSLAENNALNDGTILLKANIQSKKVPNQNGHGEKELIRNVNLTIRSGELIALLGGSGAGKSTLMNCLNGTEQSGVEGTVLVRGEDLYRNYARLKYIIGNVPQKNILHETLSVSEELENAAILRLPADSDKEIIIKQVEKTLQALNLESKRNTLIKKLSGGEQKRVNIGVELVADRQLLCLDEPDAGLDPLAKKELFETLRSLAHNRGKCVLVIIHDVSEIDLFDKIIMMAKVDDVGQLAFVGTPEDGRRYFHINNLTEAYQLINRNPKKYIAVN